MSWQFSKIDTSLNKARALIENEMVATIRTPYRDFVQYFRDEDLWWATASWVSLDEWVEYQCSYTP